MAITYVGGATAHTGATINTTDLTITLPTHQANDVAIAVVGGAISGAGTPTLTAANYTEKVTVTNNDGNDGVFHLFYRVLTSSSDPDLVVSKNSTSSQVSGALAVFRNVDNDTPFDVTETNNVHRCGNQESPPITPTADNGALVLLHSGLGTGTNTIEFWGNPTTPAGLIEGPVLTGTAWGDAGIEYILDYGTAATITPTDWQHQYNDAARIINAQTEANFDGTDNVFGKEGSFTGGSSYSVSDTITMTPGGAVITVGTVDGGGAVTAWTQVRGTGGHVPGDTLTQSTTSGGGSGFTMTVLGANLEGAFAKTWNVTVALRPGGTPTITDVNTTESWTDGDTGLVATGTNFL